MEIREYTNKELLQAVKTIHDYCATKHMCSQCAYSTPTGECLINQRLPEEWSIIEDEAIFRAFKQ